MNFILSKIVYSSLISELNMGTNCAKDAYTMDMFYNVMCPSE